jgi:hypothetical protein
MLFSLNKQRFFAGKRGRKERNRSERRRDKNENKKKQKNELLIIRFEKQQDLDLREKSPRCQSIFVSARFPLQTFNSIFNSVSVQALSIMLML